MSGWKYRWHHQKLSSRSVGFEVGAGRWAWGWSARFIGRVGRHYVHAILTYDYPRGAGD